MRASFAFDQILFHVREALVVADVRSGRIVRWNPAAELLFGYMADEAIGRPIDMLMPAPVARSHRKQIAQYARTGEAHMLAARSPIGVAVHAKNGQELCVGVSMVPLEQADDPRRSVLFIFRDNGCQKQAEMRALEAARADAAHADASTPFHQCSDLLSAATVCPKCRPPSPRNFVIPR